MLFLILMKPTIHFLFSMVLIFSILAPSVLNLYVADEEAIVLMDTSEEEKQEKQEKTEKEVEEKILQLGFFSKENAILSLESRVDVPYLKNHINFSLEIKLPPPKTLV